MKCPACQKTILDDSRFCSYCGDSLQHCMPCNRPYPSDAQFCGICGGPISPVGTPTVDPVLDEDEEVFGYLYDLSSTPVQHPLFHGDNTIGAGGNNDIIITRPAVSWNHAILICRNDRILCQDSASTNGTFLNGQRIHAPKRLLHGDILRFGSEEYRVWLKGPYRATGEDR
jgi:predicted nucleic acid-binding Zn ribbon protein